MNEYGKFDPNKLEPPSSPPEENDAVRDKKKKSIRIPVLWGGMEAVEKIAIKLIREHHHHLASADIKYICRNKAAVANGRAIPGKAYKMSRMYRYLVECDFVIEVALELWNEYIPDQRIALLDHLLTHCWGKENEENGEMTWSIVKPNIAEFPEVAERRGQWNEGLVELEKCLRSE